MAGVNCTPVACNRPMAEQQGEKRIFVLLHGKAYIGKVSNQLCFLNCFINHADNRNSFQILVIDCQNFQCYKNIFFLYLYGYFNRERKEMYFELRQMTF